MYVDVAAMPSQDRGSTPLTSTIFKLKIECFSPLFPRVSCIFCNRVLYCTWTTQKQRLGRHGRFTDTLQKSEQKNEYTSCCQRAVLTALSSNRDLDSLAAKRDAVFEDGRQIPFVQDGVVALAVDLLQGFSGEFF